MMKVSALKTDEIDVECELRGILTGSAEAVVTLQRLIVEEKNGSTKAPQRMHSRASKNPNAEIECCRNKLIRLQQDIADLKSIADWEQVDRAEQIWCRLVHVCGRLERVSCSPTYQEPRMLVY